jgi:hypothetical protein
VQTDNKGGSKRSKALSRGRTGGATHSSSSAASAAAAAGDDTAPNSSDSLTVEQKAKLFDELSSSKWAISAITGKRGDGASREFLVAWEPSWEPENRIRPFIDRFLGASAPAPIANAPKPENPVPSVESSAPVSVPPIVSQEPVSAVAPKPASEHIHITKMDEKQLADFIEGLGDDNNKKAFQIYAKQSFAAQVSGEEVKGICTDKEMEDGFFDKNLVNAERAHRDVILAAFQKELVRSL